jgi:hypothetical protein
LQIKKEEEELNRGWGAGPVNPKKPLKGRPQPQIAGDDGAGEGEPQQGEKRLLTTIQIFGDTKAVEIAVRMIDEAVENKEQKQKQRQKEYDRKRDQKRRDRQLYHLRHSRDYEILGLPLGASKIDIKKAFRWVWGEAVMGMAWGLDGWSIMLM